MNCYLSSLGVIDHDNKLHKVSFEQGLNVITGKSSTGKSALIEIFDYCFGSSENTIPEGVISENAKLFFTIFHFKNMYLVLARTLGSNKLFLREADTDITNIHPEELITDFFDQSFFLSSKDFKPELGKYFGLDVTDVATSNEEKMHRGGRNKARPSIRSFTSFMLQHQNLVANKHALFYRFDEKKNENKLLSI
ncbi:MAG: AAA family ATPase [Magnetovibrio sp.]|nr:AAA family ATPase [Magnetovibrio sp.]